MEEICGIADAWFVMPVGMVTVRSPVGSPEAWLVVVMKCVGWLSVANATGLEVVCCEDNATVDRNGITKAMSSTAFTAAEA
jgi:hypothetical protein